MALTFQNISDKVDHQFHLCNNNGLLSPGKQQAAVLGQTEQGLAAVSTPRSDRAIQPNPAWT